MFVWHEQYRIDGGTVDKEHQKWFAMANAVLELDRKTPDLNKFKELIRPFYDYCRYHFDNE